MTVRDYFIKYGIKIRPFDDEYITFDDLAGSSIKDFECYCLEDVVEVDGDKVLVPVYNAIVVNQRIEKIEKYGAGLKKDLRPYLKKKLQESSMTKLNLPDLAR